MISPSHTVLVIDADNDSTEMLKVLLSLYGFQVSIARDSREVLFALELKPRSIILELTLPNVNGIVVARYLRHELPESTIIAHTATYEDFPNRARAAGIDWFLYKPVDPTLLLACLTPEQFPEVIVRGAVDFANSQDITIKHCSRLQALSKRSAHTLKVAEEVYARALG